LRDFLERTRRVVDTFTAVKLIVALLDGRVPHGHAAFFGLHAANGVADHFRSVTIETTGDLVLDESFHLGRELDVHGHRATSFPFTYPEYP